MRSNLISRRPRVTGPTLADLDVYQLAEALGASDMPPRARDASREQLAAWAQQGLDRLGADAVRDRADRTTRLDYGSVVRTNTPEQTAELRGLWPSVRHLDATRETAFGLRKHLAAGILGVSEREIGPSGRAASAVDAQAEREFVRAKEAIRAAELSEIVAEADAPAIDAWTVSAPAAEVDNPEAEMEAAI
jgi:hypothetical protein